MTTRMVEAEGPSSSRAAWPVEAADGQVPVGGACVVDDGGCSHSQTTSWATGGGSSSGGGCCCAVAAVVRAVAVAVRWSGGGPGKALPRPVQAGVAQQLPQGERELGA